MGLNVNYSLFKEGSHSSYAIPEYKKFYNPVLMSEDVILSTLLDFNQQIRESQYILSTLYEKESINESTAAVNISNTLRNILKRVKEIVMNVLRTILKKIRSIIDFISNKSSNAKDIIENKYKTHERVAMLKKALDNTSDSEKTIYVRNIVATRELLDKDFPDTTIIGGDLMTMATDTMNNYCINIVQKDGLDSSLLSDTEEKASESFTNFIENNKDSMLRSIFGKFDYDPTNIIKSANDIAIKAFGPADKVNTILTTDLYLTACDNLDNNEVKNIIADLRKIEENTNKNIAKVSAEISNIERSVTYLDKMANKSYNITMKDKYYKSTKTIIDRVNRSLNVIRQVVDAATILLSHKMGKIYSIYGPNGDSARIKKVCHSIIAKNIGISEDVTHESYVYNGFNSVNEDSYIQDDFNEFLVMAEDAFMEREFSGNILTAIMEAEGDNNSSNDSKPQTTEPTTTENKQNIVQKAGASILQWLKEMVGKVGNTLERFKARIEEVVIKNVDGKTFWDKNKESISKLTLNDTKVNQWYKFNIDSFSKSTYVKFDINSNDLKSDEDIQNAILRKITSNPPATREGETFKDRINHAYQGEYVDDKNGEGQPLSNVGYDHTAAYTFIDDFITKGFGGDTLGNVTEDYKNLDNDFKNINKNYNQLVEQRKSSGAISQENSEKSEEKKTEPQNASAMIEDDFKFNLAEHFGLIHHEASFTVGQNDSQSASALGGGDEKATQDKELDEMIRRCFKYNTIAITAKMTCALSAYKQYMGLFKAVYGAGKKDNKNATNNENN